jgi:hypothetical protein
MKLSRPSLPLSIRSKLPHLRPVASQKPSEPRANTHKVDSLTTSRPSIAGSNPPPSRSVNELGEILKKLDKGFTGTLELVVPLQHNANFGSGVRAVSGAQLFLTVKVDKGKIDISGKSASSGIQGEILATKKRVAVKLNLWTSKLSSQSIKFSKVEFALNKKGNFIAHINLTHAPECINKSIDFISGKIGGKKVFKLLDMKSVEVKDKKISVSDFYTAFAPQLKKLPNPKPSLAELIPPNQEIDVKIKGSWSTELNADVSALGYKHVNKQEVEANQSASKPIFPAKVDIELDLKDMNAPLSETGNWVSLASEKTKAKVNFSIDENGLIDVEKSSLTFVPPLKIKVANCLNPIDIKFVKFTNDKTKPGQLKINWDTELLSKTLTDFTVLQALNASAKGFISNQINKAIVAHFKNGIIYQELAKNKLTGAISPVSDNTHASSTTQASANTLLGDIMLSATVNGHQKSKSDRRVSFNLLTAALAPPSDRNKLPKVIKDFVAGSNTLTIREGAQTNSSSLFITPENTNVDMHLKVKLNESKFKFG